MKIKKATQLVILVVALVSVIGVGAVSYAAWSTGSATLNASASVGSVSLLGFADGASMTFEKSLVPNDQTNFDANTCATVINAAIPAHTSTSQYQIKVSLKSDGTTLANASEKVYVQILKKDVAAPTATDLTTGGWTAIGTDGVATATLSATENAGLAAGDYVLYLALASVSNADMSTSIGLTVALVEVTA